MDQDLEILTELAKLAEKQTELGSYYDIVGWTAEFAFTLRNELDYTFEGHHADRIRKNFAGDDALHVPRIFWEYTTKRVLTMEEISGIKINDTASLDKAGLDRKEIARRAAHIALTMTYDHGFFHADPHPGNFFVMPDESIGLIDFGMVGRLDENLRLSLIRLEMALIHKDVDRLVEEMTTLGITGRTVKKHVLKRDVDHFLYRFYDKPLKEIGAADTFHALISIALRHRLQLPSDLVLLFKVIAMSEGLGAQLDPDFKLMEFAEPYFERFWLKNRSLGKQVRRIVEGTQELSELGFELPRHARGLIGQLERGEITIVTHHEVLEEGIRELRKASSRVSMSILTASLVIGLGLLMLIYHPPG